MDSTSPTTGNTRNVVNRLLDAIATGDLDGLLALLAPDIHWEVPGDTANVPWLGVRRTADEVIGFFSAMEELTERQRFDIDHLLVDGDAAVIIGHARVLYRPTGRPMDTPFAVHVVVDAAGRVSRFFMFEDSWTVAGAAQPAVENLTPVWVV
jgi:ketosteroid isomerase-like protein